MREDLIAVRIEGGDDGIGEVIAVEVGARHPALAGREARFTGRKEVGERLHRFELLVRVGRVADDRHAKDAKTWRDDDLVLAVIVEITHRDLGTRREEHVGRETTGRGDVRVGRVEGDGATDRYRLRADDNLVAAVVIEVAAGDAVAGQERDIEERLGQVHRGAGLSEGAEKTRRADDISSRPSPSRSPIASVWGKWPSGMLLNWPPSANTRILVSPPPAIGATPAVRAERTSVTCCDGASTSLFGAHATIEHASGATSTPCPILPKLLNRPMMWRTCRSSRPRGVALVPRSTTPRMYRARRQRVKANISRLS